MPNASISFGRVLGLVADSITGELLQVAQRYAQRAGQAASTPPALAPAYSTAAFVAGIQDDDRAGELIVMAWMSGYLRHVEGLGARIEFHRAPADEAKGRQAVYVRSYGNLFTEVVSNLSLCADAPGTREKPATSARLDGVTLLGKKARACRVLAGEIEREQRAGDPAPATEPEETIYTLSDLQRGIIQFLMERPGILKKKNDILAASLCDDRGTVSEAVDDLIEQGLVTQPKGPRSGVRISDDGITYYKTHSFMQKKPLSP